MSHLNNWLVAVSVRWFWGMALDLFKTYAPDITWKACNAFQRFLNWKKSWKTEYSFWRCYWHHITNSYSNVLNSTSAGGLWHNHHMRDGKEEIHDFEVFLEYVGKFVMLFYEHFSVNKILSTSCVGYQKFQCIFFAKGRENADLGHF